MIQRRGAVLGQEGLCQASAPKPHLKSLTGRLNPSAATDPQAPGPKALMRGRSRSSGAASAPRAGCCCRRWREAALYRCLHRRRPQWREAALCRCLYRRRRRWRAAALRQVSGTECRGCRCCGVGRRKTPVRLNMLFRSAMSSRARQWLFHCPIPVLDCLTPQHGGHRRGFRW